MKQKLALSLLVLLVGAGLSYLFFSPLWSGGGWIGGDLYTYYFPQKMVYQEALANGEWNLWNDLVAHGYPQLAESQTGVFYPPHQIFYRLFDLNRAYHYNQLLHYILAFAGMVLLARTFQFSLTASLFAGLIYTYGWFPVRACLEWAIIGGAWLPFGLWAVARFLQTGWWRYLFALAIFIALQLLAGHFVIAFLTLLSVAAFALARLTFLKSKPDETAPSEPQPNKRHLFALVFSIGAGFLLAGIQLLPTWELKQQSQREEAFHDVSYGHMPPEYLSQVVVPWEWYPLGIGLDEKLQQLDWLTAKSGTNKVEAHLYFGLLPLALAFVGLLPLGTDRVFTFKQRLFWWSLAILAVTYAFGWWLPIAKHLPGFSFFIGPGRYGLLTTLAIALLAAEGADALLNRFVYSGRSLVWGIILAVTTADLYWVSQQDFYAVLLEHPPYELKEISPVRQRLAEAAKTQPVRLFAPGQNLPTLLGYSAVGSYLGLSPAEYYDEATKMPEAPKAENTFAYDPEFLDWIKQAGVTHLLTQVPLSAEWPASEVELIANQPDPFLNASWGRGPREPLYLSRLKNPRGRVFWKEESEASSIDWQEQTPTKHQLIVATPAANQLVITELFYPGWNVTIDGEPALAERVEGMYRGVQVPAGEHVVVWEYQPASLRWGAVISLLTLLILATLAHIRFWHPEKLKWLERRDQK